MDAGDHQDCLYLHLLSIAKLLTCLSILTMENTAKRTNSASAKELPKAQRVKLGDITNSQSNLVASSSKTQAEKAEAPAAAEEDDRADEVPPAPIRVRPRFKRMCCTAHRRSRRAMGLLSSI